MRGRAPQRHVGETVPGERRTRISAHFANAARAWAQWFRGPGRDAELARIHQVLANEIGVRKQAQFDASESVRRYEEFFAELPLAILEEDWRAVKTMLDGLVESGVSDLREYFQEQPGEVGRAYELAHRFRVTDATIHLYRATSRQEFIESLTAGGAEPDELRGYRDTVIAFYEGETFYEYEADEVACDGTAIQTRIRSALPPSGRSDWSRVLVTMEDITQARISEKRMRQAQKMEAVGQLTGGIAHDFNNLLSVIQGNAELLYAEPGVDASLTTPILRATERGAELTQQLLAFSRQQPLRPQAIDMAQLIGGSKKLFERVLGESIRIEMVLASDLWLARADASQLENALLNMALNARDAMPQGGCLTILCSNSSAGDSEADPGADSMKGEFLRVEVLDTGEGMSEEVRARACEPFFTTKEVGAGSGLGLSMVYGFARQSGGSLEIQSEVGKGTRIVLQLPRAESAGARDVASAPAASPHARGETVLVVEDDPDVRSLAARMLRDLDYRVVEAWDARSARSALVGEVRVDLVLSDVVLPGGTSGPDFCREAASGDPKLKFLFMSGHPAKAGARIPVLAGDTELLRKPFTRAELAIALRGALEGGSAGRSF